MSQLISALSSGLALGAIYVLLALGFVIIYRATGVVSFAQPALMVFSTYWVVYFATVIGWNFWVALLVAASVGALTGAVIERIVLRPLVGRPVFSAVMVTIGADIILRVVAHNLIGVQQRNVGDPFTLTDLFQFGDVTIPHADVATVVVAAVIVGGLLVFYRYSRFGLAMRATSLDQEAAMAQGIPVGRMFGLAWAIAGALAAVAGTWLAATGARDLSRSTFVFALNALPVIILGGLDSIAGAMVGGILIGIVQQLTAVYVPEALGAGFSIVVPYILMLLVLLVRPYGLFGTPEVQRV